MTKTILVTGGAGYIGSHACKILAEQGYQPIAYDNLSRGHEWAVKWGPLEKGDIADSLRLGQVIKKYKPQAVMHFAAFAYVGESVEQPAKYYQNNVAGTLNLLQAMQQYEIPNIIFSSSCSTYGEPQQLPIDEDHQQQPINPYGFSKLCVERMLKDFQTAYGIKHINLRYFNAASADPETAIGEDHDPETHLIPLLLDVAAGRREKITIFGDDYETKDGSCIRDYIHIVDLAQAHLLALQQLESGADSASFNLGNGHGFSVKEVIDCAEEVSGKKIKRAVGPRRVGDPAKLIANAQKAINRLKWRPHYAKLAIMLEHAWRWQLKHFA